MFRVDLSDEEHGILKAMLRERLGTLEAEMHRSKTLYFADDLKREETVLHRLSERLEGAFRQVCGRNAGRYDAGPAE